MPAPCSAHLGLGTSWKADRHVLSPQLGFVELEDDVEVGANTTIDRGTYGATRIGAGTKIDNLVMIGHNCQIGRHNMICGQVGIAGSCIDGRPCRAGGTSRRPGSCGAGGWSGGRAHKAESARPSRSQDATSVRRPLPVRQALQVLFSQSRLPGLIKDVAALRRRLAALAGEADDTRDAA